jgi:hypothetical protein
MASVNQKSMILDIGGRTLGADEIKSPLTTVGQGYPQICVPYE